MNFDVRFELTNELSPDAFMDADDLNDNLGGDWELVRDGEDDQYLAIVTEDDE